MSLTTKEFLEQMFKDYSSALDESKLGVEGDRLYLRWVFTDFDRKKNELAKVEVLDAKGAGRGVEFVDGRPVHAYEFDSSYKQKPVETLSEENTDSCLSKDVRKNFREVHDMVMFYQQSKGQESEGERKVRSPKAVRRVVRQPQSKER